jgi:hypothetical protein
MSKFEKCMIWLSAISTSTSIGIAIVNGTSWNWQLVALIWIFTYHVKFNNCKEQ